eukprot:214894-Chlamydomonas_euryale.AAC.2
MVRQRTAAVEGCNSYIGPVGADCPNRAAHCASSNLTIADDTSRRAPKNAITATSACARAHAAMPTVTLSHAQSHRHTRRHTVPRMPPQAELDAVFAAAAAAASSNAADAPPLTAAASAATAHSRLVASSLMPNAQPPLMYRLPQQPGGTNTSAAAPRSAGSVWAPLPVDSLPGAPASGDAAAGAAAPPQAPPGTWGGAARAYQALAPPPPLLVDASPVTLCADVQPRKRLRFRA